jgi:cell division protein ZapA (FtsZ GTPase activity inhibitor)
MSQNKQIKITIQGQTFRLRCPAGEEDRLRTAAELVDAKIAELTHSGNFADSRRATIMAAFHFAYELVNRDEGSFVNSSEYRRIQERLRSIVDEIDSSLMK